jgi:hypothetical protein
MIINLESFEALAARVPYLKFGCVVDTNILFAGAYPVDRLNTWAEKFFKICHSNGIPIFTNINIRAEFMDLFRRALIVESLLMLRSRYRGFLNDDLEKRLKALDTRVRENINKNRSTQLSERDIKEYRKTLLTLFTNKSSSDRDLWEILCYDFLEPQLRPVWLETTQVLGINFAGSRSVESVELFSKPPNWDGATEVMGQSGMGSADAMIVNFFACSKFSLLATADVQAAEHAHGMLPSRTILLPGNDELI